MEESRQKSPNGLLVGGSRGLRGAQRSIATAISRKVRVKRPPPWKKWPIYRWVKREIRKDSGYGLALRLLTLQPVRRAGRRFQRAVRQRIIRRLARFRPNIHVFASWFFRLAGNDDLLAAITKIVGTKGAGFLHVFYLVWIKGMVVAFILAREPAKAATWARLGNVLFRPIYRDLRGSYAQHYVQALHIAGLNGRLCREYASRWKAPAKPILRYFLGLAFLFEEHFAEAEYLLERANWGMPGNEQILRYLALSKLMLGKTSKAEDIFAKRVKADKSLVMAHQNMAGRYDRSRYSPARWELAKAGPLQVYDHLNLFAEQYFHLGKADTAMRVWRMALLHQRALRKDFRLPQAVIDMLSRYPGFDPKRPTALLPYEWVTQFGHIGLLDTFLKIQRCHNRENRNFVLLAPADMVANQHYLSYWETDFIIVRDQADVTALFPWQRYIGEGFMPFLHDDGSIEPWTRVGARAQAEWARFGRPPLLKPRDEDEAFGNQTLRRMGLPSGAWFVGLHVREGSFHEERKEGGSEHRNADIEDYLGAIRQVTEAGGWVIRLGDRRAKRLPSGLEGVIDYPHTSFKSERMDTFLLARSRFIIGTTSGLTTVASSFGTPALLVNTISNDWQLWSGETDFMPKKLYDRRSKRNLTFRETYTTATRDLLINRDIMDRRGLVPIANSRDEITEAVRWKLDGILGDGKGEADWDEIEERYRRAMSSEPHMFGAARPVPTFLLRNQDLL